MDDVQAHLLECGRTCHLLSSISSLEITEKLTEPSENQECHLTSRNKPLGEEQSWAQRETTGLQDLFSGPPTWRLRSQCHLLRGPSLIPPSKQPPPLLQSLCLPLVLHLFTALAALGIRFASSSARMLVSEGQDFCLLCLCSLHT